VAIQNVNYQLGLLHFVHLLVNHNQGIDEREKEAFRELQREEEIPDALVQAFQHTLSTKSERELFQYGIHLLNLCNDQEKLCALAQLYQLAERDNQIHVKEVRLLLYSLKSTDIDFEDVEMTARLVKAGKTMSKKELK